jgi:hypothetical protein
MMFGTTQAGSDGAPSSSACEHVAHKMICGCKRTLCLQRTFFGYALKSDVNKERKFFQIIVSAIEAKIILVNGRHWSFSF